MLHRVTKQIRPLTQQAPQLLGIGALSFEAEGTDAQQLRSLLCQRTDLFGDAMKQTGRSEGKESLPSSTSRPSGESVPTPLDGVQGVCMGKKTQVILLLDS